MESRAAGTGLSRGGPVPRADILPWPVGTPPCCRKMRGYARYQCGNKLPRPDPVALPRMIDVTRFPTRRKKQCFTQVGRIIVDCLATGAAPTEATSPPRPSR